MEGEQNVEQQQKTHTVSRSFYPRRVSDNVTHRTDVMLNISSPSEPKLAPSGAELYRTFTNKLFLSDLTQSVPVERRRSASAASEKRLSHELGQFFRPDITDRSLSITSTPSTIQRSSSRQSESEESISMIDVIWQHRKPTVRKRQRPRPKHWEETEAETLSVVRTKLKQQLKEKSVSKQQQSETERQKERSRRDKIAKQLEMVEQQERKIKEELARQQKMMQQLTAVRQQEIERERVQDFLRQQELVEEQEIIRKQELTRLSEIQQKHELARKLAFRHSTTDVVQAPQTEKVKRSSVSYDETSLISVNMASSVRESIKRPAVTIETVKLPAPEESASAQLHKLEMVVERTVETPLLSRVESVNAVKMARTHSHSCCASAFVDELSNVFSFSSPLHMRAGVRRETLELPAAVRCVDVRTILPPSERPSVQVLEEGAAISVAKEMIHSEQVMEILTPQDLHVVELVEKSVDAAPVKAARHSDSSEDDVFYDASDVDVHSSRGDAAETEQPMPTGSLLMAPVFELPLTDVTAFDGAGAILECRVIGNPTPEVMWFVNGVEIRSMPPEVTVSYHAGVCRLVIVDVMPDDEGEYTVRAINEAGSCLTSAYLTVLRESICLFRIFSRVSMH